MTTETKNIVTDAQYVQYEGQNTLIRATINGNELFVPMVEENADYQTIMSLVEQGELTIADAE